MTQSHSSNSSDERDGSTSPRNRSTEGESSSVTSDETQTSSSSDNENSTKMSDKQQDNCRGRNNPSPPCSGGSSGSSSSGSGNDDDGYSRSGGEDGWEGSTAGSEGWERDRDSGNSSSEHSQNGGRRRKRPLDATEKAQQNRDRNREHARNTRLRKKAYVNKMEQLVQDLSATREQEEQAWQLHMMQVAEVERSRKYIAALFFQLYFSSDTDRSKWTEVVEESFSLTCPITPYRSFSRAEVVNNSRVLFGVDAVMADAMSLAVMVEGFGSGTPQWRRARMLGQQTRLVCTILPDDILSQGNMLMCRFNVRSEGATQSGAMVDFSHIEMMQCKFSYGNKLLAVEIMFDVMGLMQQLQRVSGVSNVMPVVPNTVDMACQPSTEARVVAQVEPPFKVSFASDQWVVLSGGGFTNPVNEAFDFLQGPLTDVTGLLTLLSDVQSGKPGCMLTTSYKKDGSPFMNFICVYPLSSSGDCGDARVTHFLAVMQEQPDDITSNSSNTNSSSSNNLLTNNNSSSSNSITTNNTLPQIGNNNTNAHNAGSLLWPSVFSQLTTPSSVMTGMQTSVPQGLGSGNSGGIGSTGSNGSEFLSVLGSNNNSTNSGGSAAGGGVNGGAVMNLFGQPSSQGSGLMPLPDLSTMQTDGSGMRGSSSGSSGSSVGEWWQQPICCCGSCRFCLARESNNVGNVGWGEGQN